MTQIWHTPSLHEIEEQKHWELEGVERGVRKVRADIDNQKVSDSALGSAMAQKIAPPLIEKIREAQKVAADGVTQTKRGARHPWWYLILLLPADKLAVITIKSTLSAHPRDFTFNPALTSLASSINRSVQDQLDYEDWRGEDKRRVDRFFSNYNLNPRNLKRLRERMEVRRVQRWDNAAGIQLGTVLLTLLCDAVPEWFSIGNARLRGGRWEHQLHVSQAARDTLFKISEQCELSQPSLMPMICQPADWRPH